MSMVITKPGIYQMSIEAYHDDPAETPSISATGMHKLVNDCPARFFFENRRLNPKAERPATKSMNMGKAAHDWVLQGGQFEKTISVLPPELDLRSNAGKQFAAQAEGEGKTLIRAHEFEQIKAMKEALMRSEMVRLALSGGAIEPSLFWKDDETGVWLRCRPDFLPTVTRFIPDYKTARSCIPADFARAVTEYGYHIQAAHYLAGIEAVTGEKPEAFFFIVQETSAPYLVSLITLDEVALWWGQQLVRRAIRVFAECLDRGWWPGYDGQVCTIGLPGWALKEYEGMDALGLFDKPQHQEAAE